MPRPRARRPLGWAAVLALVLALAVPSGAQEPPGSPVLSGRVLAADGTPSPGLAVQLVRRKGFGEQLFGAITSLLVIGLGAGLPLIDCLQEDPSLPICEGDETLAVRADAEGRWQAAVPDGPGDYDVTVVEIATDRPVLQADVAAGTDVVLPDLRRWDPAVGSAPDGGLVRLGVEPMPEAAGWSQRPPSYAVALRADGEERPVGEARVSGSRAEVDARLLEDAPGRAVFTAQGVVAGVGVSWYSPAFPYPAPLGAPLSRGAGCTLSVGLTGGELAQPACWLTDGRVERLPTGGPEAADPLGRPLQCRPDDDPFLRSNAPLCSRPAVGAVTLDLATAQPVGAVVLRRCPGVCLVETSADGAAWAPGPASRRIRDPLVDAPVVLDLPAGTTARFVRVRAEGPAGREESLDTRFDRTPQPPLPPEEVPSVAADLPTGDLVAAAEVSVWPPLPPPADQSVPLGELPGQAAPDPAGPAGPPGVPGATIGLAAALVALAGGSTALAHRPARRRPARRAPA